MPYNPGLTSQMAFYSRRMREEAAIRRTGMVFMLLAFIIQFFAILSPPQPTIANSSNDLINGGISSASGAAHYCRNNIRNYKDILNYYGISCDKVANAPIVNLSSTSHNGRLYSMGWNPQGQVNNNTGKPTNEQPVNIPGIGKPVYWRLLKSWDSYASSSYKALSLTNSQGVRFYILLNCGNLVAIGIPTPPPTHKVCPYRADRWTTSPDCKPPCPYNPALTSDSPNCKKPTTTIITDSWCPYNKALKYNDADCKPCPYNSNIWIKAPECKQKCPYNSNIFADDALCKPCDTSKDSADALACLFPSKAASNTTKGISDANGSTAGGGDVIEYKLSVKNNGKRDVEDYVFAENMNDVLDYADITDFHGGKIDNEGQVTWPAETIKAGATVTHQITVKIKNPIPQTPASKSDPNHFDLVMTNVFGNSIVINLPGSPTKTVEIVTGDLPNTGPGTTFAIVAAIVLLSGYFYQRSRLLSKESTIALKEMAGA